MKKKSEFKILKRASILVLCGLLAAASAGVFPGGGLKASAKTQNSSKAENVFFYVRDSQGKSVLMDIIDIEELKGLAHGQKQADGSEHNYYISNTDNYPTTQYCEAIGFTVNELVDYVKKSSGISGADELHYADSDVMRFMATDGYGNYTRSWTYDELYGQKRYYFEGLYDVEKGWKTAWEIGSEDNAKYGMTLEDYNAEYRETDPYYDDKRAVFESGEESEVILATMSYSGRTTSETLVASTEKGLAGYIEANGGVVSGCLEDLLEDTWSLRLCIPMSEADLMSAHRTAYDNFKWIYNVELDMSGANNIVSEGTVAQPESKATVSGDGNELTVELSCATEGASIYYSFEDAPQTLYTGPVTVDISGRDLESNPVTFYVSAVKEGFDDVGVVTMKYPQSGVRLESVYSVIAGTDVTLKAEADVSQAEWDEWAGSIIGMNVKTPGGTGYAPVDSGNYTVDNSARTITIDKSVFTESGSYSFSIYAKNFSNKNVTLTAKKAAPEVSVSQADISRGITLTFDDSEYQKSIYAYVESGDGESSMIPTNYLDRSNEGQLTIMKEYFGSSASVITSAGTYRLELVNNSYSPSSQVVEADVTGELSADGADDTEQTAGQFADVPTGKWYSEAVAFVTGRGYFSGTSDTEFSPDTGMTRAMFVTVLGRIEGIDSALYASSDFSDVNAEAYYGPAVKWASDNGIVTGAGNGLFNPSGLITREQMALMLYNYVKFKGGDISCDSGRFDSFSDSADVHSWAADAVKWASDREIINGSNGMLNPSGTASRAQVAQIIMNLGV